MNEDVNSFTDSLDLFNVDGLDNDDQVSVSSESQEESGQYQGEYEDNLSDIVSGINLLHSDLESMAFEINAITIEQQIMGNNISIMNENLISCFHLMVVFFIILVIKLLFGIFNKYLGLGQA